MESNFSLKPSLTEKKLFDQAEEDFENIFEINKEELESELPDNISFKDLIFERKSISVVLVHSSINCPCIEVVLELFFKDNPASIGNYKYMVDMDGMFVDEFLNFTIE